MFLFFVNEKSEREKKSTQKYDAKNVDIQNGISAISDMWHSHMLRVQENSKNWKQEYIGAKWMQKIGQKFLSFFSSKNFITV